MRLNIKIPEDGRTLGCVWPEQYKGQVVTVDVPIRTCSFPDGTICSFSAGTFELIHWHFPRGKPLPYVEDEYEPATLEPCGEPKPTLSDFFGAPIDEIVIRFKEEK